MSAAASDEVAERRAKAVQMRLAGMSYGTIARGLGLPSAAAAAVDVQRSLVDLAALREAEDRLGPELEHSRLDSMENTIRALLQNASGGGDARLADPSLVLACTDRLLKIMELRSALPGGQAESADEIRRRRYPNLIEAVRGPDRH